MPTILILLITSGFSQAEMTTSQIAVKYSPSVVTIVALDENDQPLSLGSGFFINENGDIATNHHVLEGCVRAIIKTNSGAKGEILEILKDDPDLDLLVAKTSIKNIPPLPLGDSESITVGEDIVAIGNPVGLEGTISKGIVSGIRKTEDLKLIQITAPISPGSSGGPVFNMTGKVIGVATAYLDTGQNLNFAMPINFLNSLEPNKIKITSLKKSKTDNKNITMDDKSLVKVIDIYYEKCADSLCGINFSLQNGISYPIKNIMLFFVYKKHYVMYPSIYYELEDKWNRLSIRERKQERKKIIETINKIKPKEWYDVVSYSDLKIQDTILPKLGLQFNQTYKVENFYLTLNSYYNNHHARSCDGPRFVQIQSDDGKIIEKHPFFKCDEFEPIIDIRVLDYEIIRTN